MPDGLLLCRKKGKEPSVGLPSVSRECNNKVKMGTSLRLGKAPNYDKIIYLQPFHKMIHTLSLTAFCITASSSGEISGADSTGAMSAFSSCEEDSNVVAASWVTDVEGRTKAGLIVSEAPATGIDGVPSVDLDGDL
jgi:hypothetical protein